MTSIRSTTLLLIITAACLALGAAPSSARAEDAAVFEHLKEQVSPALVTIKYVLKQRSSFGSFDSEIEITGAMIEPDGLVLCASSRLGGGRGRFGRATPTDIRVLTGDDPEGLDARIIVRDSDLDLAWVRIKEPGDRQFPYVDLAKDAEAELGRPLFALNRMGRFFDRAPLVTSGYVAGQAQKPRRLVVAGGAIELVPGLPVFDAEGAVFGVSVIQRPDEEEMEASAGGAFSLVGSTGAGLILPAEQVRNATAQAKALAARGQGEPEPPAEAEESPDNENDETPPAADRR